MTIDPLSKLIFAHRGDQSGHFQPQDKTSIEERLPAYLQAFLAGAHGIECDVSLSIDGVFIVRHDHDARISSPAIDHHLRNKNIQTPYFIYEHTALDLQKLDPGILTLTELLKVYQVMKSLDPDFKITVEIKEPTSNCSPVQIAQKFKEHLEALDLSKDQDIIILAFNHMTLAHLHECHVLQPKVWLFYALDENDDLPHFHEGLPNELMLRKFDQVKDFIVGIGPDIQLVQKELISFLKEKNLLLPLYVWTFKMDLEAYERAKPYVNVFLTDYPMFAAKALKSDLKNRGHHYQSLYDHIEIQSLLYRKSF